MSVTMHAGYVPVSLGLAVDSGLITEEEARARGWSPPPPPPRPPWWRRLWWRWQGWRERLGRRVGGWIAGVDLADRDDW